MKFICLKCIVIIFLLIILKVLKNLYSFDPQLYEFFKKIYQVILDNYNNKKKKKEEEEFFFSFQNQIIDRSVYYY